MSMRWLLRLYPRAWRTLYGEEFGAVLDQQAPSLPAVIDIAHGALDAHLHSYQRTGRRMPMLSRLRASAIAIFCAYMCFALAYGFLQKLADPQAPFDAVAAAHGEVGAAFTVVVAGSIVALLAILTGGAPICCAVVARAITTRQRDILSLCAVPPVALIALTGWTLLVARELSPNGHGLIVPTVLTVVLALSWVGLCGLAVIVSVVAVALAVARSAIGATLWRFALAPAAVATPAMAVTLTATVLWGASVKAYAPVLFDHDLGAAWFGLVVGLMAASTAIAGVALRRGYTARAAA